MKKFSVIGLSVVVVIVAAFIFWHHFNKPVTVAHSYMVAPDTLFAGLQNLITPKAGESYQQLLTRYFKQQGIYLEDANALGVYPKAGTDTAILYVRLTKSDRVKVDGLIVQIAKAKGP